MSWRKVPVRRLFRVVNGGTPTSDPLNWNGDIPWATPVDLGRVNGAVLSTTERTISVAGLAASGSVPAGSLLISTRAPIGYVAETTTTMAFNQGCRGLQPLTPIDVRFFRYQLLAMTGLMSAAGQGSTFAELTSENLAATPVVLPGPREQRAIANFLDAETARIDALIARKGELVQGCLVRWTSDLCATLLPGGIDSTTGRPLVERWPQRPLRRLLAGCWGGDWGGDPGDGDVDLPCVRAADFEFLRLRAAAGANRSFTCASVATRALRAGDLVIEKSGGGEGVPVGRVVAWRGEGQAVPTNFAGGLRPAANADADFVLLTLRAAYEVGLPWRSIKQTTGLQNLDLNHYLSHYCHFPPRTEQRAIAKDLLAELERLLTVQTHLQNQINFLRERRQALITAAVTGELEIPGVAA